MFSRFNVSYNNNNLLITRIYDNSWQYQPNQCRFVGKQKPINIIHLAPCSYYVEKWPLVVILDTIIS